MDNLDPPIRTPLNREPVTANKNANTETKDVLLYFFSLYNTNNPNHFLAGQNIGHANAVSYNKGDPFTLYQNYVIKLEKETGKSPAILAVDYGWEDFNVSKIKQVNTLLIDHWKKVV